MPSFNQGRFLEAALDSVFMQDIPLEVFVMDGGSTDQSVEILERFAPHLNGWRTGKDGGQAAAINEGISKGTAPYVCWLNSDDLFEPYGLRRLVSALEKAPLAPAAYGLCWNQKDGSSKRWPVNVEDFSRERLASRCIISQPATLVRRTAWEAVGGLDESLHMALDYDLWWRLYKQFGALAFANEYVAVNRVHSDTKTKNFRSKHYQEAISVVRRHNGHVPMRWWLAQPYSVWFRTLLNRFS